MIAGYPGRTIANGGGVIPGAVNRPSSTATSYSTYSNSVSIPGGGPTTGPNGGRSSSSMSERGDNMRRYYVAFRQFIGTAAFRENTPNAPGVKARPKLQRLTDGHFKELATDVYDELMRRINPAPNETQHLAPRSNIHPKRNEAREKLSLLSPTRFTDLVSDLLYEARRRDPSLDQQHSANNSQYYNYGGQANGNVNEITSMNSVNGMNSGTHNRHMKNESMSDDMTMMGEGNGYNNNDRYYGQDHDQVKIPARESSRSMASNNIKSETNTTRNSSISLATSRYSDMSYQRASSDGLNVASLKTTRLLPEKSTLVEEDDEDLSSVDENREIGIAIPGLKTEQKEEPGMEKELAIDREVLPEDLEEEEEEDEDEDDEQTRILKDKDEQIEMLVNEGSRMDKMINELERRLEESEALKATLVEENGRLHDMVGELEDQRRVAAEERDLLREKFEILEKAKEAESEKDEELIMANEELEQIKENYEKLQNEYEENKRELAQIKDNADKNVKELESTMEVLDINRSQLVAVQGELEQTKQEHELFLKQLESTQQMAVVSTQLEDKEHELTDLRQKHEQALQELDQQRKVTEQVRTEASAFLEEMRALTQQHDGDGMGSSARELIDQLQTLKMEVQEWKSRYSRAKSQIRTLKTASMINGEYEPRIGPPPELSNAFVRDNGRVAYSAVTRFQVCMDEFIYKSRAGTGDLLENLHSVVVATRQISQEVGNSDQSDNDELEADIAQWTSIVSKTANQLITASRNHRMAGGLAPFSILDAAASDLAYAVIELAKLAGVKKDMVIAEDTHDKENWRDSYEFGQCEPAGQEIRLAKRDSKQRASIVSGTRGNRDSNYHSHGDERQSRISILSAASGYDKNDPDNTVSELQAFLEEKTGTAIEYVQQLLSSIKASDDTTCGQLVPIMDNVIELMDEVIDASGASMRQSRNKLLKDKGAYIVQNLIDCVERLKSLHEHVSYEPADSRPDGQLCQRIAGASFDIAKCTKELVKTVEEVSLIL